MLACYCQSSKFSYLSDIMVIFIFIVWFFWGDMNYLMIQNYVSSGQFRDIFEFKLGM